MKKNIILLLAFITIILSCKLNNEKEKIYTNKIDILANRYFELKRFSGTVLVVKENSILYHNSFGLADYENSKPFTHTTAFKIGEISEFITKNIVEKLVANGKIKLDDTISKYIPQIKSKFTINDLLNHNTNYPSIETIAKENPEIVYNTITFANLANHSATTVKDSNLNYNILGLVIETISGKSFQKNIGNYSNTLELESTFYEKSNSEISVGYQYHNYRNKGLELQKTSGYDLDIAFSSRGLKSSAIDLMKIINQNSKQAIDIDGFTSNDGFSYSFQNNPNNKTTIIVLSNYRQPVAKEISNSITSILEGKTYQLALPRTPFDIDENLLNDYTGNYALNESVKFEVIARNDSLFTILGPNEVYLIPQSNNQFYMQDRDAAMRFLKDSTQQIHSVELLDGFLHGQIAKRLKN